MAEQLVGSVMSVIGPVVDFKIKQHLLGYTPLDIEEERLVRAWVHLFAIVLGLAP